MALHDRDYVRAKNFDYLKMEYSDLFSNTDKKSEKKEDTVFKESGDVHLGEYPNRKKRVVKYIYPKTNYNFYLFISIIIVVFWFFVILGVKFF